MEDYEAKVNVTYSGSNGDLPDPVRFDATDTEIKQWVAEAIRGGIAGIPTDENVDLNDFVIDRFGPTDARPYNLLSLRPKTPFGVRVEVGDEVEIIVKDHTNSFKGRVVTQDEEYVVLVYQVNISRDDILHIFVKAPAFYQDFNLKEPLSTKEILERVENGTISVQDAEIILNSQNAVSRGTPGNCQY